MRRSRLFALALALALSLAAGCSRAPAAPPAPRPPPVVFVENDYSRALAEARSRSVPLFVDAWAPWCHTCLSMRAYVFPDPSLRRFADRFVWLSLDTEREENAAAVGKLGVRVLPTLYVVDPLSEQKIVAWPGSLTAGELGGMLDGALRSAASAPAGEADAALERGQRAAAGERANVAVGEYRAALRAAAPGWPARPVAVDALVTALEAERRPAECVREAAAAPTLPPGTALADVVRAAIRCAMALPPDAPERAELADFAALGERIASDPGEPVLADDRSDLFQHVVDALAGLERDDDAHRVAQAWAAFLEAEAARAPSPAARAVFDSHRLAAYVALHEPERAIPMLRQSARDFPRDYNPLARLGIALTAMKLYDDAIAALARALPLAYGPRKLRIWAAQGDAYKAKGDVNGERRALGEALDYAKTVPLTGAYPDLRDALARRLDALGAPAPRK
jgi:thioredoxin-like negative regulator of GroEL